jgi:hypothetical protein
MHIVLKRRLRLSNALLRDHRLRHDHPEECGD